MKRELAYPTNVLHIATECGNKNHSAVFPEALPEWFIKLFTEEGDWILDPFAGSGTALKVAQRLRRNSIGIDNQRIYYDMMLNQIEEKKYCLLQGKGRYETDKY